MENRCLYCAYFKEEKEKDFGQCTLYKKKKQRGGRCCGFCHYFDNQYQGGWCDRLMLKTVPSNDCSTILAKNDKNN